MKIVILDAGTLGEDIDFAVFDELGETAVFYSTGAQDVQCRIKDADVVIINKIKLDENNLKVVKKLKLICLAATGYDNVDTEYCRNNNIAVCNVVGYSTHSVAQLTVSMALSLMTHLPQYCRFVESGEYTASGIQNRLAPVYNEIYGKTWGIVGYGNIGRQVGAVASALGCRVIANKRNPVCDVTCVDLDTLCRSSDIISVHTPLNEQTKELIDSKKIALMKKSAIVINVARGAVIDEEALCCAVEEGRIGGIGVDVFSKEPLHEDSPYNRIMQMDNVCLTPHMAWGAYESRCRCVEEIKLNIKAFFEGKDRNRV